MKRKRGVILTGEGYRKLQCICLESEIRENQGKKYTLEELSDRTGLDHGTIRKVLEREEGVDKRTLERFFTSFNLSLDKSDYSKPSLVSEESESITGCKHKDFEPEVDVTVFYGRIEELAKLRQWLLQDRCRLVALLGMGGIGKTSLAVKLEAQIEGHFEYVIWRSLKDAPPIQDVLCDLIRFLSDEQETEAAFSSTLSENISRLIGYLRSNRCLLILDNLETILCGGRRAGEYHEGCEGYGELLKRVGEATHRSCLLLTSREKPKEIAFLEGEGLAVRSLQLDGLNQAEAQDLFRAKGISGSEEEIAALIRRYAGNALSLKIVATTIQDVFDGRIAEFLEQEATVFGDIRNLLEQQFNRLTELEKDIMFWLAINREPVSLAQLQDDIVSPIPSQRLLEALESLGRRSLVEKNTLLFTQQPVVMEYVTHRIIEHVCEEILVKDLVLFRCHALMKATAKDYVRETQVRLILQPLIDELLTALRSKRRIEDQLVQILDELRATSPLEAGYTAGNVFNLLCHLQTDLTGYNFSHLTIWQADLRNVTLQNVNFAHTDFDKCAFAEAFGGVLSIAFSPDGQLLALSDTKGEIHLRQVSDGKHILICKGHTVWVVALVFSPDGRIFASSCADYTIKFWDVETGQCLRTLRGHDNEVWSVAFSPDGSTLASSSDDQTVKLWNVQTGKCLKTLQGHEGWVHSVAFSLDGQVLVSGSDDQTIKLWNVQTGKCLKTLQGHQDGIRKIAVHPDGQTIVSSSEDHTVKLWNISTGECLNTLEGHTNEIYTVAFSPQGNLLASGSHDQTVKLWDTKTGECLKTFYGHRSWVYSVAFHPQGNLLASGSYDQTAKLWNAHTGQCLTTFQGYTNQIPSVVFSPDGQTLMSGSHDASVKVWSVSTGQLLRTLQGHRAAVWSVALSADGQILASGSEDRTIKIWNVSTGQLLKTMQGHQALVWSLSLSPDRQTLVSASEDQTVKIWDINTGQLLRTLQGHQAAVWSVALSPDGQTLASASHDQTVKLWETNTGRCKNTLKGHTAWVWSVAFSPDGKLLASTSPDGTIRLWRVDTTECVQVLVDTVWSHSVVFSSDSQTLASCSHDFTVKLWAVGTAKCFKILQGHRSRVWSVTFSPDDRILASSSEDETIRLWDVATGICLEVLKAKKPCEQMNITSATGLTSATLETLRTLGAVGG
jgi:WD40 repeat protein/transcriptional regulator with XRE-family HTH domain